MLQQATSNHECVVRLAGGDPAFLDRLAGRLTDSGMRVVDRETPDTTTVQALVLCHDDPRIADLRKEHPACAIIAVGPPTTDGWVRRAIEAGASDCIAETDSSIELAPMAVRRAVLLTVRQAAERTRIGTLERDLTTIRTQQESMKQELERLSVLAATDSLTGLANRRGLMEAAEVRLAEAERYGDPVSFALLDLDAFKPVNDVLGHPRGDDVLKAVADSLRTSIRAGDVAARLGGDEFAVLMPRTDGREAYSAAQRLLRAHMNHPVVCEVSLELARSADAAMPRIARDAICGMSIGLASSRPGATASFASLLDQSDRALARAKGCGGSCIESCLLGTEVHTTPTRVADAPRRTAA